MARRERWLRANPLCLHCEREGRVGAGQIVDHIIPLAKGGADDESNLQSLCREHAKAKDRIDFGWKPVYGCDVDGMPLPGSGHPWTK